MVRVCSAKLEQARKKIEVLTKDGKGDLKRFRSKNED